jgi:CRP/FNR family transcriptional regulator, cyclic AMP receptor protein
MPTTEPDLLLGLDAAAAADVRSRGNSLRLAGGEVLFRLGELADRLFLVERGCIALSLPIQVYGGERELLVEERPAGHSLGWSALVPPHRFTLNATAPVETDVLVLPRAPLLEYFRARPDVGYMVTRNVAAIMGHRLQVLQTMWLREMQRTLVASPRAV